MSLQVRLSKKLSKITSKNIITYLVTIFFSIVFIPLLGRLNCSWTNRFGKFWVDIFSPVSLRSVAYSEGFSDNLGIGSTIAYAIGLIFIIGVLIPMVTNYLRSMGDRYLHGTLDKYSWNNHALFLGFDNLMVGTLKVACKKYEMVVIAVPDDVMAVRTMVEKHLPSDSLDRVEIVHCNLIMEDDLVKKACIKSACRIYIIGQE